MSEILGCQVFLEKKLHRIISKLPFPRPVAFIINVVFVWETRAWMLRTKKPLLHLGEPGGRYAYSWSQDF